MIQNDAKSGGGAATQGGVNYQNRVAAWICVHILTERSASPIGPTDVPTYIRFESQEPIDDLLVGTAQSAHSFGQAKRTIGLLSTADSDLASVTDQFLRQYLSGHNASGARPWSRILDPTRDRLVLVTTSGSPSTVRIDLAAVLDRARGLTSGQPLSDVAVNQAQEQALTVFTAHLRTAWQAATQNVPTDADLLAILKLSYVVVLDAETNGVAEREALSLLEDRVLDDRQQAGAAWAILLQLAADLSQRRSGVDEAGLRAALERAGVRLKGPARYDKDISKLRNQARETVRYLRHNSRIPVGRSEVRVDRLATEAIRQASESGSLVVVGWPGSGKSGVLHDFAESAIDAGRDVIFMAVDQIGATSLGELRNELGLEHELIEILRNWPGERSGILVIDALDAARGDPASGAFLNLIRSIVTSRGRWHLVASIRKYDLRYSPEMRDLFRNNIALAIPQNLQDREFFLLRHVNIPLFTDEELDTVRGQAPALDSLLKIAPPALHDLLRVPFNLRLMAEVLESGIDVNELRPIRTQSELLTRYWAYRVAGTNGGDLRERVLRRVCTLMTEARRLRAERQHVVELGSAESLQELLSNQVLVEWQSSTDAMPQRQQLAFSHNILFDFATSQLFLPFESADLVRLLATDPDLTLMIRPSIVMRYQKLWDTNRESFWVLMFGCCGNPLVSAVGKVIGASVLAESARTLQDLDPLIAGLQSNSTPQRASAEFAFRHVVGALTAGPATTFAGVQAGPYCELLRVVSQAPNEYVAGYAETLLRVILEEPANLTADQFLAAGEAARNLLSFAWSHQ